MATVKTAAQLVRNMRRDLGFVKNHWVNTLQKVGSDAVQRSRQTRTYGDVSYRAINAHFKEVVSFGESMTVQIRRADESTFDVVLKAPANSAVLYIGNYMQYMVWVERIYGRDCVVQELPRIRAELPKKLAGAFKFR